jgi:hypothetical protein
MCQERGVIGFVRIIEELLERMKEKATTPV